MKRGNPRDVARLARLVSGKAIALVLGGGGARGLAHLGVMKALLRRGIPIDAVGGTSQGAFMGAAWCLTQTIEGVEEKAKRMA